VQKLFELAALAWMAQGFVQKCHVMTSGLIFWNQNFGPKELCYFDEKKLSIVRK